MMRRSPQRRASAARVFALCAVVAAAMAFSRSACAQGESIVKIFSSYQGFSSLYPWEKEKFSQRTAFGTLIGDQYIVTTADTVTDHTYLELKKTADDKKYQASVCFVDYGCNIALLKANDKSFYAGLSPARLSEGLKKSDKVQMVQIKDSNEIYAVEGLVEKISVEQSYLGWDQLLSYVVSIKLEDRPYWAEPVMKDGKLAGIAISHDESSSMTDVIPVEIIRHFVDDASDGTYDGFPDPGFFWEPISNPHFKEYLGMKADMKGVFITRVIPGSSAHGQLQKGDILLSVDGAPVDDQGYVAAARGNLLFTSRITSRSPGEKLPVEVFRGGVRAKALLDLKRFPPEQYFIPLYCFDQQPRYIIEGGLVIQELTTSYLKSWGEKWQDEGNKRLLYYYNYFSRSSFNDRQKLVILSFVLPDDANMGYQDYRYLVIREINGKKIDAISDAAEAFDKAGDGFITITFEDTNRIVLRKQDLAKANERIAKRFSIHRLRNL